MSYLVVFFTSLLLTIFFTPYLINFLTNVRVVDSPEENRRINENIIPRMGGIIIYFMSMISIISFYGNLNEVRFFVIASLVIVSLGIYDDILGTNWDKKFLFQAIAAIFIIYFLSPFFKSVSLFGVVLSYPFDYIILFILIVGSINAVNLMDGMDGLVSGFSLLVVSVTFVIGYYYSDKLLMILSISLIGSLIGFLKFNAYPARIFLGDTGSQSLGFFLICAALLASLNVKRPMLDLTFPVIILGAPIVDTLKVMVVRIIHKKNIFLADMSHVHYILFGMKIRHKVTVFILQGFSFFYAAAAIYYLKDSEIGGMFAFVVITIPFLFVNKILDFAQRKVHPFYFRNLYAKVPEIFITLFLRVLLPIVSILLFAILIGLLPLKSSVSDYLIILSIVFIAMLMLYSIVNYNRSKNLSDILVFVNLIMFLLYSNFSKTVHDTVNFLTVLNPHQLLILIILPTVVFFLFFRERILKRKATFLTGIDLIILVFIVLLTVSSNLLPNNQIMNINSIVFYSFLLYIFYKLAVTVKTKYQIPLYFLSFIIPIIFLTLLLFTH